MQDSENTFQQLERTDNKAAKHDAKWEAAFLAQLTHALGEKVSAFAKRRARWLEAKAGTCDPNVASELYQDAITDTWTGDVNWDPARASLELHLKRVIKSRTSNELQRLERFAHVSSHRPTKVLERAMSEAMEMDRAGDRGIDLKGFVDEVIEAMFLLAADDEEVLQVLHCFGNGVVDRRDVMHETGLSSSKFHNARRRMLRIVERLPLDLRDTAIDAMA
jgi:hypothetical protein